MADYCSKGGNKGRDYDAGRFATILLERDRMKVAIFKEATIKVGTELKSGKVIDILNDGVVVQKGDNAHKISFEQAQKELV